MIVVKKVLKSKNYKMLVWVFFMLIVLASCSKDDEPEEVIYHQSYVKGKLNDTEISMNDINALVLIIILLSEKMKRRSLCLTGR